MYAIIVLYIMKSPIFLLSIMVVVHILLLTPRVGVAGIGLPFGGRIVMTMPCLCSANFLLFIRHPRGYILPLVYQPGVTIPYANYLFYPPVNTKGTYTPGVGVCLIPGSPCTPIPTWGTIFMMGSSRL